MSDPYMNLAAADADVQAAIAAAMEARCEDPLQVAMRRRYLARLDLADGAVGVEFGSGTGHVAVDMVEVAGCAEVLGIEPGPAMIARARELFKDVKGLSFVEGDAAATGLPDASRDLVVMHTLLCHVSDPVAILAEAARVAKPGATAVIFDGDYSATTVEVAAGDPLETLVSHMIDAFVHDKRFMRRAATLLEAAGFRVMERWSEGYVPEEPAYFLSVVDRGADHLVREGTIGAELGDALKAEARARVESGRFFGFMSYIGLRAERI
jgi:arsenite methyltransferase